MIEEAITNLTELHKNKTLASLLSKNLTIGQLKAIQLGIEALERLKELREKTPTPIYLIEKPLPSEGEE